MNLRVFFYLRTMKPVVGKIKFDGYKIVHSEFRAPLDYSEPAQADHFEFSLTKNASIAEDKHSFYLDLVVEFKDSESRLSVFAHAKALFKTDIEIDESYLDNGMVKVNAPAILFPFIRAFINTLSVNSGYGQIILPSINFAKMENME